MSGSSLMNKRKRVGPRTEPCGTPALKANSGDATYHPKLL